MSGIAGGEATRIVYCEGEPDNTLLNSLLKPEPENVRKIQIETIGGKQGWGKFFDAYVNPRGVNYVALRDRDLDRKPELDEQGRPKLQKIKSNLYMTGLPCTESYFLDPELLLEYLQSDYASRAEKYSLEGLVHKLTEVIETVTAYYAVRWAFQELRAKAGDCVGLADIASSSLTEQDCLKDAYQRIMDFRDGWQTGANKTAQTVTTAEFDRHYQMFYRQFSAAEFIERKLFIFWFDGKDVLKRWFGKIDSKIGNSDDYCTRMASRLSLSKYPDLAEFRDICWKQ